MAPFSTERVRISKRAKRKIVDIFGRDRPLVGRPALHVRLDHATALLQGALGDEMVGYVVFGVDKTGHWSLGWAVDPDAVIGATLLAALAKEAINIDLSVERMIDRRIGAPVLEQED